MTAPLIRIVVTDANVLINLMHVSRLDLLARIPGHGFVIPEHVRAEIAVPEQRVTIDAAIADGWLGLEAITDLDVLIDFTDLIGRLGRGEAACIAIAAKRGWHIASDEKRRFLREATARLGGDHILTTVDLFVLSIRAGLLSVAEADADKVALQAKRFTTSFRSYGELLE